jgi:hypothetical protein
VTDSSWNPPTGPPNGVPLRPADARREVAEAIAAAQATDQALRAELAAATTARVLAADRLEILADEVDEARSLAERALTRAHESARAGQRADAGKWTAAAQVFAMRMRDGRDELAQMERRVAAETQRAEWTEGALAANVGRLEAVAAARLPVLRGRKAAKAQLEVDEAVAALAQPTDDLLAGAVRAGHAAADDAAQDGEPVVAVADDDLESEVDIESTDDILGDLRAELGLPAPAHDAAGVDAPPNDPGAGSTQGDEASTSTGATSADDTGDRSDDRSGETRASAPSAPSGQSRRRGSSGGGRSRSVPAARR